MEQNQNGNSTNVAMGNTFRCHIDVIVLRYKMASEMTVN